VVLEPPLLALARGRLERPLRAAGLALMALTPAAAALAPSYEALLAALALYGLASGLGTNLAEAALVSAAPGRTEAVLARWSLLGLLGDLAAPAALAAAVALGFGWRGALLAVAALAAVQAALALRAPLAAPPSSRETDVPLREALRAAASCPPLLGWSLAAVLCGLMDEVLVAFGALWLSERVEGDATRRALILSAWVLGGVTGSALLERLATRLRATTLLAAAGLGCAAAYSAWLAARSPLASALALGLAGMFTAAHYPLLRARAFAAMPDRPHLVVAAGALLGTLDLAIPLAVGIVADAAGLLAAMLVLLAQPVGVILAAAAGASHGRRPVSGG
jgi:predicted MFS family arabinose efflux permease